MEFNPVLDRVLINAEEAPKVSEGGILLDAAKRTSFKGFVVKIGPDVKSVKEGDYVYYDPGSCGVVEINGNSYHIARDIPEGAIAVVLESKS